MTFRSQKVGLSHYLKLYEVMQYVLLKRNQCRFNIMAVPYSLRHVLKPLQERDLEPTISVLSLHRGHLPNFPGRWRSSYCVSGL